MSEFCSGITDSLNAAWSQLSAAGPAAPESLSPLHRAHQLLLRLHSSPHTASHACSRDASSATEPVDASVRAQQQAKASAFLQLADVLASGVADTAPASICNALMDPHRRRLAGHAAREMAAARSPSYSKHRAAAASAHRAPDDSSRPSSQQGPQSPARMQPLQFGSIASPSAQHGLASQDTDAADSSVSGVDATGGLSQATLPAPPSSEGVGEDAEEVSMEAVAARVLEQPARFGDFGSADDVPAGHASATTELIDSYFALLRKASEAFGSLQVWPSQSAPLSTPAGPNINNLHKVTTNTEKCVACTSSKWLCKAVQVCSELICCLATKLGNTHGPVASIALCCSTWLTLWSRQV